MTSETFTTYHVESRVEGGETWIRESVGPNSSLGMKSYECGSLTGLLGCFSTLEDAQALIEERNSRDCGVMVYRIIKSRHMVTREVIS